MVFRSEGIDVISTSIRARNVYAFIERWVRSALGQTADHQPDTLKTRDAGVRRVLQHAPLEQQIPVPNSYGQSQGLVHCRKVLGGIIHDYYRDAAKRKTSAFAKFLRPRLHTMLMIKQQEGAAIVDENQIAVVFRLYDNTSSNQPMLLREELGRSML